MSLFQESRATGFLKGSVGYWQEGFFSCYFWEGVQKCPLRHRISRSSSRSHRSSQSASINPTYFFSVLSPLYFCQNAPVDLLIFSNPSCMVIPEVRGLVFFSMQLHIFVHIYTILKKSRREGFSCRNALKNWSWSPLS